MKREIVDHDHTLTVLVLQMEGDISYFIEMQKREREVSHFRELRVQAACETRAVHP